MTHGHRAPSLLLAVLLALVYSVASASGDGCKPTITQSTQSTWVDGYGDRYTVWTVLINVPEDGGALISLELSVDAATNAAIGQYWEVAKPTAGVFTLPYWRRINGGVPAGQAHQFGYIIRSADSAVFSISSWTCAGGPSPSASPSPSARPSPSPFNPPTVPSGGVCQAVLILDNYIVRNLPGWTEQQIKDKYAPYFQDVMTYYHYNFNFEMNLTYYYVEMTGSFSDTLDGDQLLSDFSAALSNNRFGQPAGACIYHLLTARQPYGIGGIASVGSACTGYSGPGLSVDGHSSEDPELVIRRTIHEIGHNFGGNHPDTYPASKGYTCSINQDRASDRILRHQGPSYNYLSPKAFISDCATLSIIANLPAYDCMWSDQATASFFPKATLYKDADYSGDSMHVPALLGTDQCYNILNFNDALSSFSVEAGTADVAGLRLFFDVDCLGGSVDAMGLSVPAVPGIMNDQASSFRFIMGN